MRARTRCFFPRFNHFEFCAPLVEASSGNAQLPRQFPYVLAGPQALDGHSLKFPGVSPSLHCDSFPGNCAHFCVSVQGFSSVQVLSNAIERLKGSPASPGPKRVFRTVVSELARGLTWPCKPVGHANSQADDNAWRCYRIGCAVTARANMSIEN